MLMKWYPTMMRLLVALLLVQLAWAQLPVTCSSCDKSKAALIGKWTCDADGSLIATCKKGPIKMKVNGKSFLFDRVSCIEGDWFGTSCGGMAVYLTTNLPASSCWDDDYPEVDLEGSQCKIRPIGLPSIYEENFVSFPKFDGTSYSCQDEDQWERFRGVYAEIGMYAVSDVDPSGYKLISGSPSLTCLLNAASGKYELANAGVFLGTNQIECLYKKCPPFQVFSKSSGKCKPIKSNICGHALVGPAFTEFFELPALDANGFSNTTISANVTHIAVYPGCKAMVEGTKVYPGSTKKFPLVLEQYYGLWEIFSLIELELFPFPGLNVPTKVFCTSDGSSPNAPVLNGGSVIPYKVSHESRYASFVIGATANFVLEKLESEFSMALAGSGTGSFSCLFKDALAAFSMKVELNFALKKIIIDNGAIEREFKCDSDNFHVRFMYHSANYLHIYVNGHFVYKIYSAMMFKMTTIQIQQTNVNVGSCNFFVPKKCRKGHKFSKCSGDCEYTKFYGSDSEDDEETGDKCAVLSSASVESWTDDDVKGDVMPVGYEFKTSSIQVRQGCVAYAYNDEDASPCVLRGKKSKRLEHWKGRYSFPNFYDGTCVRPERGLKHLECYCDDYNKLPTSNQTQSESITIDITGDFVFGGRIVAEVDVMTSVTFANSDGDFPLVLFFGDGKLVADHRVGGCFQGQLVAVTTVIQDPFDCRIHLAAAGYEIRMGGHLVMTYPYKLTNKAIMKANIPKKVKLGHYRSCEAVVPGGLNFTDKPLLIGDFVHFNGVATDGSFNITLLGSAQETVYTLQWKKEERKIVQILVTKTETFTVETSACSLFLGVEFDIVLANKAHSIEVYINGELIDVLGETVDFPEKKFCYAKLVGQVTIFEQRRGPKKIEGEPKWKKD